MLFNNVYKLNYFYLFHREPVDEITTEEDLKEILVMLDPW